MSTDPEKSSASARFARYGRLSATMAGLATRIAGERWFGLNIEQDAHAQELLQTLGGLKGPVMKVGQILATIPEALPPVYAEAFQQLQAEAPSMGRPFVRRRMKAELGPDWETRFKEFDQDAAAAASLGQVHKAIHQDGRLLACKLQYPDMCSTVEADLNQLKLLFSLYKRYDPSISTSRIHEELSARLHEELDYRQEARHCKLYAHMLQEEPGIHVPEVIDELSTDRLLTATWLDGEKILSLNHDTPERRNRLALTMFRAWYVPLYHYGVIHGDPHPGNYTVREDDGINLLDFGCIRIFRPAFIGGVINLYHALVEEDEARAVHAYETWGFTGLTKDQIETLTIWAKFLYAPVMEDTVRTIGETKHGVYGRETAIEVHTRLRESGKSITVPREFVFMDRAALGLGSVFIRLQAQVNWHRLFNEMIEDFDENVLAKRQEESLERFGIRR